MQSPSIAARLAARAFGGLAGFCMMSRIGRATEMPGPVRASADSRTGGRPQPDTINPSTGPESAALK
ncbi:hypothetical protein Pth03_34440 [Planotetraspora thailandica]|uniref:Uncharacterized protein n=1 Tax=Planotetraspora thailandica TaxID=487172 RepID=A0A8J3XWL6_9ACTN|nr:hypothetical protein Pth03_34440 [Planotetraspora thailandica]